MHFVRIAVAAIGVVAAVGVEFCKGQDESAASVRLPEIDAQCWLNAQPVRIHSETRLILVEFWSAKSRESREFAKTLSSLYRAYRERGTLLIVALTADTCEDARHFAQREKIEYKIGAESRSLEDYKIKDVPSLLLIDAKDSHVVAKWSGSDVKIKPIVEAIRGFMGAPAGASTSALLSDQEREVYNARVDSVAGDLSDITSRILSQEGSIGAETLAPLNEYYDANLSDESLEDSGLTRAQRVARQSLTISEDSGYWKLYGSGRLDEEARKSIQNQVLRIAEYDPSPSVRLNAAHAIRKYIGRPGDESLRSAVGAIHANESDPFVKAALEDILEALSPEGAAKRAEAELRPISAKLNRLLIQSPDPTKTPWADAYAYRQSVSQKSLEQLLTDYAGFPDPPDDEIGRQNATLKRLSAMGQIEKRLNEGQVRDLGALRDQLTRILTEEPDLYIRSNIVWNGLQSIARQSGSAERANIVQFLQALMADEPDRQVRATIEATIEELKKS